MKEYTEFITDLEEVVTAFAIQPLGEWQQKASRFVNGLASERLRNLVPIDTRRESGAFFTSDAMALDVLETYNLSFNDTAVFYDPACGAGNLLIAVKDFYAAKLEERGINIQVRGTDIHHEFVEATKLRLSIYELSKDIRSNDGLGSQVALADGLENNAFYAQATHVITNPPFNQLIPRDKKKWGSGKISAAALFIDNILEQVNCGVQVLAILPDVLRSGSRYQKWRTHISRIASVEGIKLLGQFDKHADVDVFSVLFTKRSDTDVLLVSNWDSELSERKKISDIFNVCVGPVVDNRDDQSGPLRPYFVSRGLASWTEVVESSHVRRHTGRSFNSPFVVIKRTSRHGDSNRAIATIVNVPEPVFIDNHLIVLQPKSGNINDCKNILNLLGTKKTTEWIDMRIRCRHLTVKVISNIPI